MKAIDKIFNSRKNVLLAVYAVVCVVGGQLFVNYLFKDLETKRNHFVEIKVDEDTIIDTYKTRYTPGSGYFTEIKTSTGVELPILLENDSNSEQISTDAIISKEKDSSSFEIIKGKTAYIFNLRSLTKEKTILSLWILFGTSLIAFVVLRKIF
jgi:hypothetical protein